MHEMGYSYKKGKSRSKRLNTSAQSEFITPKRRKITSDIRLNRISEIQERLIDILDQIRYKEKRRENAQLSHNYKECDRLTEQMSTLRCEKRKLELELSSLQKKHYKSKWYFSRKKAQVNSESTLPATPHSTVKLFAPSTRSSPDHLTFTSSSISPSPNSPGFSPSIPSSSCSSSSSNSPSPYLKSPLVTPQHHILTSPTSSKEPVNEETDHDTVILSASEPEDDDANCTSYCPHNHHVNVLTSGLADIQYSHCPATPATPSHQGF